MSIVENIQKEVSRLSRKELISFRAWLDEYEANLLDKQIEQDVLSGKLDKLAKEADYEFRAGRCTEL